MPRDLYTLIVDFHSPGLGAVRCAVTHKCIRLGVLALCTLVSAFAQTAEQRRQEPFAQSSSQASPTAHSSPLQEVCPDNGQPQPLANESANASPVADGSCLSADELPRTAERFVNDRLVFWRRHLNLEEWQISIVMTRRDALKDKTLGGIRWDKRKKSAVMSVLAVSDYRLPFREMLDDMEFTVVHELVHLELASLPRSEASRRSEEHAVNRLAEALLKLNRGK